MELSIEKMIYGGDGLARLPAEDGGRSRACFVPFVLAGERVEATLTAEGGGFVRARVERMLKPSPQRIEAACPHFTVCGGCHYQHAEYAHQLEIKRGILRETLQRTGKLPWEGEVHLHPSPPWNYRNRARVKLRATPFAAGYFQFHSHALLPVESCPIASPLINRALNALWEQGRGGGVPQAIQEIEFFANAEDSGLLLELHCDPRAELQPEPMAEFAEALRAVLPAILGTAVFSAGPKGPSRKAMPAAVLARMGAQELAYQNGDDSYTVSAGSFFQANRFLTHELITTAVQQAKGEAALDLYAGVGLFTLPLARRFKSVTAVEGSAGSVRDLRRNAPPNARAVHAATRDFLEAQPAGAYDFVIADPPRSGLSAAVVRKLLALGAPRMAYVSCDPATLARDLNLLCAGGYRIRELHLLDLFPQTYHLETIAQLERG